MEPGAKEQPIGSHPLLLAADPARPEGQAPGGLELYRLVVDHSRDLITLVDASGAVLFASPSWRSLMGHEPDALVGRALLDLVHPDDVGAATEAIERTADTGSPLALEMRLRDAAGGWVEIEGIGTAIHDARGSRPAILLTARDVTGRKEIERRTAIRTAVTMILAEAPSLAEATPRLLNAIGEGLRADLGVLWTVDRRTESLRCQEIWHARTSPTPRFEAASRERSFGLGEGFPGRVWQAHAPVWLPDLTAGTFARTAAAVEDGLHGGLGLPIGLGDEALGVMEFFFRDARPEDPEVLDLLAEIGSHIGQFVQRKRAEEDLAFQKSLLESQTEVAIDGILVVAHDRRIVSFNRRFTEMWGIDEEVVRTRSDDAALEAVEERLADPDEFLARVAYLYSHPDEESRDEIRLKDGHVFDRFSAPIRSPDGTIYGRVWFFRDISERKRQEETLRFLANVSEMLTWSLDYRQTLTRLARLAVPFLADWCIVYLQDEDGSIDRVALEHVDPAKRMLARGIQSSVALDPNAREGVPAVLRSGRSLLLSHASREMLVADVVQRDRLDAITAELDVRSWICVPLSARGRTFGAISFITAESGRTYGQTDLAIAEDLARRAAMAVDNVRLYQERDKIARTLQQSLLPPELPLIPGIEIAGRYLAAGDGNEVGGDFYDVFETGDRSWAITIGDVCGKGVDAAAVMALARYTLHATAMSEETPSGVLSALNSAMVQQVADGRFCTVCFARLRPLAIGARVVLSCGGHPLPLLLHRTGTVETVGTPGMLLGLFPQASLTDQVVDLRPGDALVLFTDGVIERQGPDGEFGEDRLRTLLSTCLGMSAAAIVDRIEQALVQFGTEPPRDDVAILVLRVSTMQRRQRPAA